VRDPETASAILTLRGGFNVAREDRAVRESALRVTNPSELRPVRAITLNEIDSVQVLAPSKRGFPFSRVCGQRFFERAKG
jgi:hypothetical protein